MLTVKKEMIDRERFEKFSAMYKRRYGEKLTRKNIKEYRDFAICKVTDKKTRDYLGFTCVGVSCNECSKMFFEKYPDLLNGFLKESNIGVLK